METASVGSQSSFNTYKPKALDSKEGNGNGKLALGLLAGASVGVLAGMLLAPERGKVLRNQVANSATTLGGQVTKAVDACKTTVGSWTASMGIGKSKSKGDNSDLGGSVYRSPYTDSNKWDEDETNNMIRDASEMPG